jgi:hypothetical protein
MGVHGAALGSLAQCFSKGCAAFVRIRQPIVSFFADAVAAIGYGVRMTEILHNELPPELREHAPLPGVAPLNGDLWLRVDEAYAGQCAYRRKLLAEHRDKVLWQDPKASDAVSELFDLTCMLLPELGFKVSDTQIHCPDGARIACDTRDQLAVLGQVVQEDLCLMQKRGDAHVLTAAVLCFPASWTLSEKAGKALPAIHRPVPEYDADVERRVQRLFDGVQVGRPLWRNNMFRYLDPDLHQPRRENDPKRHQPTEQEAQYIRAERQCILRLPRTGAVVFSIHSYVVKRPV